MPRPVDLSKLPAEFAPSRNRGVGIFIVLFALFWGGMPTAVLITEIAKGSFQPGLLFLLFFTVIGGFLVLVGLDVIFSYAKYRVSRESVECEEVRFLKSSRWREPLSNYKGVLSRSEYHQRRKSSYTLHIVEIVHPDKKRTVPLYASRSAEGLRNIWENSAQALGLPALEFADGRMQSRAPEDLDRSVQEKASANALKVEEVSFDHPPPGVSVEYVQGNYFLTIGHAPVPSEAVGPLLVIPALFIGFPLIFKFYIGALFFLAVFGALAFRVFLMRTQLRGAADHIELWTVLPFARYRSAEIKKSEIEGVVLKNFADNTSRGKGVVIQTDRKDHPVVFMTTNQKDIVWLKNAVLAMVLRQ